MKSWSEMLQPTSTKRWTNDEQTTHLVYKILQEMAVMCRSYGYTKVENEDPEEKKHRQTLFLIYKTLEEADKMMVSRRKKPSWLRLRMRKLKVKVGKRLKRIRKTIMLRVSKARAYRSIMCHFKIWRRVFHGGASTARLPEPYFSPQSRAVF
ncbi:hypothetical protein AKJ16_DCAP00418 [Drosera capensis]